MSRSDGNLRLSVVMEWANTRLHGTRRAWRLLEVLTRQWRDLHERRHPESLGPAQARFLESLEPRAELVIVSGEASAADLEAALEACRPDGFDVRIACEPGLEYYSLKNLGARKAGGDILLFLDSDVLPDEGWLAHLLGTFCNPEIQVAAAQTYVRPTSVYSTAFALCWSYRPRDREHTVTRPSKIFANTIAFRRDVFPPLGFAELKRRTRGASSLLRAQLAERGIDIWENSAAAVSHPPPTSLRHLIVRALAHGRDIYMKDGEGRSLAGLSRSVTVAMSRAVRGFEQTLRHRRDVGLETWQVPAVFAICSTYYGVFALGGVLTYLSPEFMGRSFRV